MGFKGVIGMSKAALECAIRSASARPMAVAIATPRPLYPKQMSTPGAGSCTCG